MIPRSYPTLIDGRKSGYMRVFFLTSVSGLTKWIDYIPVKTVAFSATAEGTTNANGHINVTQVASSTALRKWVDYIPVYEDGAATVAWSTNANGYIPVNQMLDLDFRSGILDSRITFTRADASTCATYFDSTGRLQLQGRNILTYSSTFTNAAWTKTDVTPTLGESSPLDVGYLMTEGSAGNAAVAQGTTVAAGATITVSYVLKRGNTDWIRLEVGVAWTDYARAFFNLNTGVKGTATAFGAATNVSSTQTSLGGGWYRCTLTVTPNGTYTSLSAQQLSSSPADNNASTRVSGATYTVSAAQLELGSTATSYSATTTAANSGPRFDYDPATPAGVTGGELALPANWGAPPTGYSVVGSSIVLNGTEAGFATMGVTSSLTLGKTYKVVFTISSISAGSVQLVATGAATGYQSTTGTFTSYLVPTASGVLNVQNFAASTACTITNISVQEVTFTPRGLLIEESRQNLLLQSRDMTQAAWTKTDVTPARTQVGIDGVANTACLMTEGSAGTANTVQGASGIAAGSTMTYSAVIKRGNTDWVRMTVLESSTFTDGASAWFNLNTGAVGAVTASGAGTLQTSAITSLGGGWYRCQLTVKPNGTFTGCSAYLRSASANSSGTPVSGATYIVDCAQLEVGAFATSIIPTTTTSLVRAQDNASMTGTNFSSWFNASAGTFVAEANLQTSSADLRLYMVRNNGSTNSIAGRRTVSNAVSALLRFPTNYDITGSTFTTGILKHALAYDSTLNGLAFNGSAASTGASATPPSDIDRLFFGTDGNGFVFLNGHIRSLRYYPTRLANATLQALTA